MVSRKPSRRCLVLMAALVVSSAHGKSLPAVVFQPAFCSELLRDNRISDITHPKFYVRIYEKTDGNEIHRIFEPAQTQSRTGGARQPDDFVERVDAVVDRDSRVVIEFYRDYVRCHAERFDADILITARSKDGPVEVPGYAVVGERLQPAPARVLTAHELVGLLNEFKALWRSVGSLNNRLYQQNGAILAEQTARVEAARDLHDALLRRRSEILSPVNVLLNKDNEFFLNTLSRRALVSRAVLYDALKRVSEEYLVTIQRGVADASAAENSYYAMVSLDETIRRVSDIYHRLELTACEQLRTSPYFEPDPATSAACAALLLAAELDQEKEEVLATAVRDLLVLDLLGLIKDTDMLVSQTKVAAGEELQITVAVGPLQQDAARQLRVRLTVEELGLVREVTDSAMFVRRLVDTNVTDEVNKARAKAAETGSAQTVTTPNEFNFSPTPGVTLGWTWRARRGSAMRFLNPGFGINVSFPGFKSTQRAITPGKAPAIPGEVGAPGTETVTITGSEINVGVGPVVTLFDNAVFFTYGYSLNATTDRRYWGVGFSFVQVISAAIKRK